MKFYHLSIILSYCFIIFPVAGQQSISPTKNEVITSVENHKDELIQLSDQIWEFAETALKEYKSSKVLADYAEAQGFTVERGVAEMPTAFIATYGSGRPIIGVLGEYDALPGLSQKAVSHKEALKEGKPGHGCGHNMFGPGSLGAALAIKEQIEASRLKGTIRFYGTPAEEAIGGKLYMARAGLFDDLDICLDWHPSSKIEANTQSSQAIIAFRVKFTGHAAHAAFDPWNGISAVDAMELYATGINYLREHVKPTVRIHYLFEDAGDAVNVVPEHAAINTWVRDKDMDGVNLVYEKVKMIAEGAALMTGAGYSIEPISGIYELLVNKNGAEILQNNLELLGPIVFTEEEIAFAKNIQKASDKDTMGLDGSIHNLKETKEFPEGGSTDVADVSWIVPEITLKTTSAPKGTPWHSWAVVACGGMSIGHKTVIYTAKALAMTMVDLYENETLRTSIRKEFEQRKGDRVYKTILPDGPPPIPETDIK